MQNSQIFPGDTLDPRLRGEEEGEESGVLPSLVIMSGTEDVYVGRLSITVAQGFTSRTELGYNI